MRSIVLVLAVLAAVSAAAQDPKIPFFTAYPGSRLRGPVNVVEYADYQLLVGPAKAFEMNATGVTIRDKPGARSPSLRSDARHPAGQGRAG